MIKSFEIVDDIRKITNGRQLATSLTLGHDPNHPVSVICEIEDGDTPETIAAGMCAAINAHPDLRAANIEAFNMGSHLSIDYPGTLNVTIPDLILSARIAPLKVISSPRHTRRHDDAIAKLRELRDYMAAEATAACILADSDAPINGKMEMRASAEQINLWRAIIDAAIGFLVNVEV